MCISTEDYYKQALADDEAEYGPDSILAGDVLVDLSEFYERLGLFDAANDCDERIRGILGKYLTGKTGEV